MEFFFYDKRKSEVSKELERVDRFNQSNLFYFYFFIRIKGNSESFGMIKKGKHKKHIST